MAHQKHLDILKQGVRVWNQWREENPETRPDLMQADLREANLDLANLNGAHLQNAVLVLFVRRPGFGLTSLAHASASSCSSCRPSLRRRTMILARSDLNAARADSALA